MSRDDLAARLLATFRGELEEQLRGMNEDLLALEQRPHDADVLKRLFRSAHTLKGAAHAAGVASVEKITHTLENRLAAARDGTARLRKQDFATLFAALDDLAAQAAVLGGAAPVSSSGPPAPPPPPASGPPSPSPAAARKRAAGAPTASAAPPTAAPTPAAPAATAPSETAAPALPVRVDENKLDEVFASAAELLGVAGSVEAMLASAGSRVAGAQARRLRGLSADMAESMRRLRLRPFRDACESLPRLVRDVLGASGKEAALHLDGLEIEADRAVLEGVREALLHLVRNAIDHGIEPPRVRSAAGKPREGTVHIAASLRGDRFVVTVADDGGGFDLRALRAQLARLGRPEPQDEREWAALLLAGGVSSRTHATAISGRGVGLDAARAAVERAGGTLDVSWRAGVGTTFVIDCPLTLAMQRVVLLALGPHVVALPSADVLRVERLRRDDLRRMEGRDYLADGDSPVRLLPLARLLDARFPEPAAGARPIVVRIRSSAGTLAVLVDDVLREDEVLIRALDGVRMPHSPVAGVALLDADRIALVLRSHTIVDAGLRDRSTAALEPEPQSADAPHVLVVDDSITTRTLERSVLETAGYRVTTAPDGADAWQLIQQQDFDVVLSDVEMPRMDGFELCRTIRSSRHRPDLPVVLLTGLETPEQRARGLELGANAYLVKSSFDQNELLEVLRQLTGAGV